MTALYDRPDPTQGSSREWPLTAYTKEIREILGPEPPPESSCCISCLGGCTMRGGSIDGAPVGQSGDLAGETQFHLAVRLHRAYPGQPFVIRNFAGAGVTAGEFVAWGRVDKMREVLPRVDVAFLRYGIADRKDEGIPKTVENMRILCERLEQAFDTISIVLETDMWVDYPTHYLWDRNPRLAPLYERMRKFAADRGYPIVDIFANVEAETRRGNWDLRGRAAPVDGHARIDDSLDELFGDDPAFFTDIHPNNRCLGLIAEWEVAQLKELFGEKLPRPPSSRQATP